MRKIICFLPLIALSLFSCNLILKEDDSSRQTSDNQNMDPMGDPKDCFGEPGYVYSELYQNCIRPFEVGFRLNPVADNTQEQLWEENDIELNGISCFVVFSQDKSKVEIFLPNKRQGIVLNQDHLNKYSWDKWSFEKEPTMVLFHDGAAVFTAARTVELPIYVSESEQE